MVLDNYYFDTDYQRKIKDKGCKLVCIDDMHDKHYVADVVINHAPLSADSYSIAPYTQLKLGFDYALLRKKFLENSKPLKNKAENDSHVLLCIGGADFNNLTTKILNDLIGIEKIEKISIVVGDANKFLEQINKSIYDSKSYKNISLYKSISPKTLIDLFNQAEMAIVPTSTILLEALSQGTPVLTGYYVNNQFEIAESLKNRFSAIYVIGDLNKVKFNPELIENFRDNIRKSKNNDLRIIDKKSSIRLKKVFSELNSEFLINIREATYDDIDKYFEWANDEDVRNNAINKENIPYDSHVKWYKNKLKDKSSKLYIFYIKGNAIGQVRFDLKDDSLFIDYSIDKNHRGKGLGKLILGIKLSKYVTKKADDLPYTYLKGLVSEKNIASQIVFKKLGFKNLNFETHNSIQFYLFRKKVIYDASNS
ncbi:MAG: bifunctional UDP-2,4-diacetamido-2,4,6-trideoxy-beta-L-altropyranose hydrolase/GNAT family N-acetyltransferase [Bacteroidales bacterium]|nr:bifunctional UDP-2,4-diacetamido-2,4,6-trideoxy-beta-L-altropyranose hydrolase/GNAT family N-acetyltransferase [Bacteroidales bacterium]